MTVSKGENGMGICARVGSLLSLDQGAAGGLRGGAGRTVEVTGGVSRTLEFVRLLLVCSCLHSTKSYTPSVLPLFLRCSLRVRQCPKRSFPEQIRFRSIFPGSSKTPPDDAPPYEEPQRDRRLRHRAARTTCHKAKGVCPFRL